MWRISYKGTTLQEVLIMAFMNVLDAASYAKAAGTAGVQGGIRTATNFESRHHKKR